MSVKIRQYSSDLNDPAHADVSVLLQSRAFDDSKSPIDPCVDLTVPFFGARLTPLSPRQVHSWLDSSKSMLEQKRLILNHNLHSLYLHETNKRFRDLYSMADLILADGFPLLLLAKHVSRRKLSSHNRAGSLDWVPNISRAKSIKRLAVVGASHVSNARAIQRLKEMNSDVIIKGWDGEGWHEDRASLVVDGLHQFMPDLVIVGLGMPLQEEFLSKWWDYLPTAAYATVGGAIDQLAGNQMAAPRWLGRFGVEWAWRLITQPRRLSDRYLLEPWRLVAVTLRRKTLEAGRFRDG